MEKAEREKFPPLPNLPPDNSLKGKVIFFLRKVADLQVASVLQTLAPLLRSSSGNILEIGCGAQPYRHLIPESCKYQGLDWERSEEYFSYKAPDTVYYAGKEFPFKDHMFDVLFHTEVLEHVYQKEIFLSECKRVLKPGSKMFFTVPFQARYHYIPYDYWRFTPSSLRYMLSDIGFKEIKIVCRGNDITVAVYKNVSILYRWIRSGLGGKIVGLCLSPFIFLLLLLGHISLKLNIGSKDDCLGYIVISST